MPDGAAVLLPAGSACNWKVWFTAVWVELLNEEATIVSGREFLPPVAVAAPSAGRFSLPPTLMAVAAVWVRREF